MSLKLIYLLFALVGIYLLLSSLKFLNDLDYVPQVPFGDAVNITGKSDASFEYSVEQQAVISFPFYG